MGDYFGHWIKLADREGAKLPKIFHVNWFRKDSGGKFLWPGYGENSRVLAWIFRRCEGKADAVDTPIGLVPPVGEGGIETEGLDLPDERMRELLAVDPGEWREQVGAIEEHYTQFGDRLPQALRDQLTELERRLK